MVVCVCHHVDMFTSGVTSGTALIGRRFVQSEVGCRAARVAEVCALMKAAASGED